jgi:hypothetical protein
MQSYDRFICPVVDADGELCFEVPDELMEALDLSVGDVLVWEPRQNGEWCLKKFVEEKNDE